MTNPYNDLSDQKTIDKLSCSLIEFINITPIPRSSTVHTHIAILFKHPKNNPIILSYGVNEYVNNKTPINNCNTIHAEMKVISNWLKNNFSQKSIISFRRSKYNIFVTQKSKTGSFGTSLPCKHCVEKLHYFGINKIYWTNVFGDIHSAKPSDLIDKQILNCTSGNRKKSDYHH